MQRNLFQLRNKIIADLSTHGFTCAKTLPYIKEIELRPCHEIILRLISIKCVCTYVCSDETYISSERILKYCETNSLFEHLSKEEKTILEIERVKARDEYFETIGWKLENAWPLAWYIGFPFHVDYTGSMIDDEIEELFNFLPKFDENIFSWVAQKSTREIQEIEELEDYHYCMHNAIRSAYFNGANSIPEEFDPVTNGGVIHERRHSLTWMLSAGVKWEDTDLST